MAEIRGGGVGCCPPMDLMRSEPMQLVQVILPMESAHLTVSYLGDLDLVQFKDEMISSWSKPFLESRFLILTQLTSAHVAQGEEKLSVHRAMLADGEPGFYKENQMMKCSPCYGRGLIALKDGSDSM